MSRTLYVHVGPRKTGTSALQHVLRSHDNSVVVYPKVGLWEDGSHHGLAFRFRGVERGGQGPRAAVRRRKSTTPTEDIETLFQRVQEEAAARSDRNVLISSETFRLGSHIDDFVRALLPYVGGESTEVELLVVYREHFARAASWYNHRVRAVGETRTPDEFLNDVAQELCYAPMLADFEKLDFGLTVINYDPAESIVDRILAHVGFPASAIPEVKTRRVSLSPKGLLTKLAINNLVADAKENRIWYLKFRDLPGFHDTSKFIFNTEAAANAERAYEPDREYVRSRFNVQSETSPAHRRPYALCLGPGDFTEIEAVARDMGSLGKHLLQYLAPYVRDPHRPILDSDDQSVRATAP